MKIGDRFIDWDGTEYIIVERLNHRFFLCDRLRPGDDSWMQEVLTQEELEAIDEFGK